MTLEEFMKNNQPQKNRSKMKSFRDEILKLKKSDYTVQQIQDFLKDNNVETSTRNIHYYIARELRKETKNNESA